MSPRLSRVIGSLRSHRRPGGGGADDKVLLRPLTPLQREPRFPLATGAKWFSALAMMALTMSSRRIRSAHNSYQSNVYHASF